MTVFLPHFIFTQVPDRRHRNRHTGRSPPKAAPLSRPPAEAAPHLHRQDNIHSREARSASQPTPTGRPGRKEAGKTFVILVSRSPLSPPRPFAVHGPDAFSPLRGPPAPATVAATKRPGHTGNWETRFRPGGRARFRVRPPPRPNHNSTARTSHCTLANDFRTLPESDQQEKNRPDAPIPLRRQIRGVIKE